jgi:hypothetical protein
MLESQTRFNADSPSSKVNRQRQLRIASSTQPRTYVVDRGRAKPTLNQLRPCSFSNAESGTVKIFRGALAFAKI